jgi:Holliday junction resolvase RusA-like endonuclease
MKNEKITFILKGSLPAKKNTLHKGKYGWYNSKTKDLEPFLLQLKVQTKEYKGLPLAGNCSISVGIWSSDRTDLNNQLTSLFDLLEDVGIVKNDRQIKHIIARKFVDNKNPMVRIELMKD